ncbi:23923_t:CDS:2 [Dentiscutata erythropus]|uniref:23923_t:CDS:1 n=1 Tax=Dentiscutata erythropus TaxID=1348616 RepID=A0A9N8WJB4_9GLOM|nr:23923_t:CDS:2 [Dentiscutata erythropus]
MYMVNKNTILDEDECVINSNCGIGYECYNKVVVSNGPMILLDVQDPLTLDPIE